MPNWCSNKATVIAKSEEDLEQLIRLAKRGYTSEDNAEPNRNVFMMEALVPTPEPLVDTPGMGDDEAFRHAIEGDKNYEYKDWYNWRLAHWGTKWDMSDVEISDIYLEAKDSHGIRLWYSTAWSPNVPFWEYVCKLGPFEVELDYYEEGMGFVGESRITKDSTEENHQQVTEEMLVSIGAVCDDKGNIDWDESDINMWDLFPLQREKVK